MSVNLSALAGAGQQFFDNNGVILSGGKLYSYAAGTTTPQAAYTSASGATPHTNPIILNSAGRVATGEIWLTAGENYKFSLFTSTDVLIATWDNITGINGTGITSNAVNVEYDPAGSGAVATTVQAKLRESVSVQDFGAVGDGVTDDYAAIVLALTAAAGKRLIFPYTGAAYKFGTNLTIPENIEIIYEPGAILSPVAAQTITWTGNINASQVYIANLKQAANVPASLATYAQFMNCFFAKGGDGTNITHRVAIYGQGQTGGGGTNGVQGANLVVQQNAADAMALTIGLEIDVNNLKSDDPLDPTAAESHYGLYISTGGLYKVGPAAIYVISGGGTATQWRRGLKIAQGAVSDFAIDYQGDGSNGFFQVTAASEMMARQMTIKPDLSWLTTTQIKTGLASSNPSIRMYRTIGDGVNSRAVYIENTNGVLNFQIADAFAAPGSEVMTTYLGLSSAGMTFKGTPAAAASGYLNVGAATQATIGANGAASALTANPLGYLIGYLGTTKIVVPYYNG